ncbi:DUF5642 family protein [Mycolicibacterium phlei]|jgi:hypothetical protein
MSLPVDRQTRLKRCVAALAALLGPVACGSSQQQASEASSPDPVVINPARIDRVRTELPADYEVTPLEGPLAPVAAWGYGPQWSVDPPSCAALADPAGAAPVDGWSASGPGGIVYAVVAGASGTVDQAVLDECAHWTVASGRTTGSVALTSAPPIDSATTVAMATDSATVVEGGTETRSHADTAVAYLGGHVTFVVLVTDHGAPHPQLDAEFTASLLRKTVAALRG